MLSFVVNYKHVCFFLEDKLEFGSTSHHMMFLHLKVSWKLYVWLCILSLDYKYVLKYGKTDIIGLNVQQIKSFIWKSF